MDRFSTTLSELELVLAFTSIALLNNGEVLLGQEGEELNGLLLKLSEHLFGVVRVASDDA